LHAAVEGARPFLEFRVERVLGAAELGSAEGRARAADAALAVVAEHPDALVRDQYVMSLADRCRIDAARLRERLEELRRAPRPEPVEHDRGRKGRRDESGWSRDEPLPPEPPEWGSEWSGEDEAPPSAGPAAAPPVRDGVETEALRVAINNPDIAAKYLNEALFVHPTTRAAFVAVEAAPSVTEAVEAVEPAAPEVAALLRRLVVETSEAQWIDVLSRLATEVGRGVLVELEASARVAEDPLAYSASIAWLKRTLDELRSSKAEVETLEQLLDWLGDRRRVTDQG
jgi:DNA primase